MQHLSDMARPALQRLLEAVCAAMRLDGGEQHLNLVFIDGRLVRWQQRSRQSGPETLARFDGEPAVERLAARKLSASQP